MTGGVAKVQVAVVGAGPAGLMAAEALAAAGVAAHVFDGMPSAGRKFLLAGRGGLNLTHSEPLARFLTRLRPQAPVLEAAVRGFSPDALRAWAAALGTETFVGTSGRVFPVDMKAAPLLRAWLHRLRAAGVQFHMRHRWQGWDDEGRLVFETPAGPVPVVADAQVLALGGASWARLGSDGAWVPALREAGVDVRPLQPANCGFDVAGGWTPLFRDKHAGQPFKSVAITCGDRRQKGEFVATATGVEGSLVYAFSADRARPSPATARPASCWTCCPIAARRTCCARWPTRAARVRCPATSRAGWGWTASRWRCCTSACRGTRCTTRPAWLRRSRPCPSPWPRRARSTRRSAARAAWRGMRWTGG